MPRLLGLLGLLCWLAACTPLDTRTAGRPGAVAGNTAAPNPAVTGLLGRAREQLEAGQVDAAAATVERALRIAPENVQVYQALARIRLEQNDTWQAESLALKANSLAVGRPAELAENWRIIALARQQRGDMMGADAAARAAAVLLQNTD